MWSTLEEDPDSNQEEGEVAAGLPSGGSLGTDAWVDGI